MKKHPFDALSFIFGITFVLFAGALSFEGIDLGAGLLRWIGAAILLVVGIVMLFTSRSSREEQR
jgi:hypothetical protein